MRHSSYEVEKSCRFAPSQSEKPGYLSVKGSHRAQELAGITCGVWKRDEEWAQKLAHLSRGA
jgi:hypothetical protein